jgi:hypothetical protein
VLRDVLTLQNLIILYVVTTIKLYPITLCILNSIYATIINMQSCISEQSSYTLCLNNNFTLPHIVDYSQHLLVGLVLKLYTNGHKCPKKDLLLYKSEQITHLIYN